MSKCKNRHIDSIVKKTERVTDGCQLSVDSVYIGLFIGKLEMVWSDNIHPLHGQFPVS